MTPAIGNLPVLHVAPDTAVVMPEGEQQEVPAHQVRMGEIVLVKNGAKVPVDGQVMSGTGAIDEALITGESIPVEKSKSDQVFAGTVSSGGFLQVLAAGIGADTTLARIIHLVEEAQDAKARTQLFIDRFSKWYTPVVLALAAGLATGDIALARRRARTRRLSASVSAPLRARISEATQPNRTSPLACQPSLAWVPAAGSARVAEIRRSMVTS